MPLINLAAAFLVSGLVVLIIGENPFDAVKLMLYGSLGYGEGIGFTLFHATNFIFPGVSVAVAFHAGLFNIGSDGQAYIGGIGVALICLTFDATPPRWLNALLSTVARLPVGAAS